MMSEFSESILQQAAKELVPEKDAALEPESLTLPEEESSIKPIEEAHAEEESSIKPIEEANEIENPTLHEEQGLEETNKDTIIENKTISHGRVLTYVDHIYAKRRFLTFFSRHCC